MDTHLRAQNLDLTAANKFTVPVTVVLSAVDELRLHKFINLHYLSDEDSNELLSNGCCAKYPERETDDFKAAVNRICQDHTVNLLVTYDVLGTPTFEIEGLSPNSPYLECQLKKQTR